MFIRCLVCIILYSKVCYSNNTNIFQNVSNSTDKSLFTKSHETTRTSLFPNAESGMWVPRVVNGWPAKYGDVPYQVAMKMLINRATGEYKTFCGATIIGPSKMLTAAHCFEEHDASSCHKLLHPGEASGSLLKNKYAVAGNLKNKARYRPDGVEGQWRTLHSVKYPRNYRFPAQDIAIAYSNYPFVFNSNIGSIPIATRHTDYRGKCLVSGFGRTGPTTKDQTEILLLAHLDVMPRMWCTKVHHQRMDNFVCTSSMMTDVGKGDSGGPLVCAGTGDPNEQDKGVLVGVVSGHTKGRGSFFTRVSKYLKFIRNESTTVSSMSMYMHVCNMKAYIAISISLIYKKIFLF